MNQRGLKLRCSHWEPIERQPEQPETDASATKALKRPAVIYLHGNCGCRLDALDAIAAVLPLGASLFTMDMSGSGMSEGIAQRTNGRC
mgnify:FL=1